MLSVRKTGQAEPSPPPHVLHASVRFPPRLNRQPKPRAKQENVMHSIIYLVGLIVVVLAVLSLVGLA